MLFSFTREQEKYLIPVLGNGWICIVENTPSEMVKFFKEFNRLCKETFAEPEIIHFI